MLQQDVHVEEVPLKWLPDPDATASFTRRTASAQASATKQVAN
jgi:hypothetical protein